MITKKIADDLVQKHQNFYRKDLKIDGVDVYIYNYLLVDHNAFQDEYSKELRGLTITKENAQERVFLSIPKFFNLNETPETVLEVLTNKKIKKVQDKVDGSMIQFVQINGNTLAKTKQSFDNPQANLAQEILESSAELQFFLLDCWANNYHPSFELIGPSNKHVVEYDEDKLVLIAVRSSDGKFIDIDKFYYKYTTESLDISKYTLEEMMHKQSTQKGVEGFVVKFTDESIIKIKTLDYISKHRLQDEGDSYKIILQKILDEEIDDVLGVVVEQKKKEILELETLLINYVNHWTVFCFNETRNISDRKAVADKYVNHRFFGVIMSSINKANIEDVKNLVIKKIRGKYNKEEKAKKFFKFLKK